MQKITKKMEKKIERKNFLMEKMKKMNTEVEKINNEIEELQREELAEKMKNLTYVLKQKNLDIKDIVKAIEKGDLSILEEKMIEGELEIEELNEGANEESIQE